MTEIKYIHGDLFKALKTTKQRICIPHVCNNKGGFGKGFVVPLSQHFPSCRQAYQLWTKRGTLIYPDWSSWTDISSATGRDLGVTQFVQPKNTNVCIANMVAQDGYGGRAIRYNHLAACMEQVADTCLRINKKTEIYAPLFGAGLAGGTWRFIRELIEDSWLRRDIPVTIFTLDKHEDKPEIFVDLYYFEEWKKLLAATLTEADPESLAMNFNPVDPVAYLHDVRFSTVYLDHSLVAMHRADIICESDHTHYWCYFCFLEFDYIEGNWRQVYRRDLDVLEPQSFSFTTGDFTVNRLLIDDSITINVSIHPRRTI